jgi:hypothetical protein
MAAELGERGNAAGPVAEQHDGVVADPARQRRGDDLVGQAAMYQALCSIMVTSFANTFERRAAFFFAFQPLRRARSSKCSGNPCSGTDLTTAPRELSLADVGIMFENAGRQHQEPWRAEAALQPVMVPECLLQRMQLAALR